MGPYVSGDAAIPQEEGVVVLPFEWMSGHLLALGAWGSGTTETALRVAEETAAKTSASIFYFNAKREPDQPERFAAAMRRAGRTPRSFPEEAMSIWRGDSRQVFMRLQQLIMLPPSAEPAAAKVALQTACRHPDGPPRSLSQLLRRLRDPSLFAGDSERKALSKSGEEVAMRLRALLGGEGLYDGDWSWEDADAAYVTPPALPSQNREELNRFLVQDLRQYLFHRKQGDGFSLVILEGFRANEAVKMLPPGDAIDTGFLICLSDALAGEEAAEAGLLFSVETVLVHKLRSNRGVVDLTFPPLDLELLNQPAGTAWVVREKAAAQVAVHRATE